MFLYILKEYYLSSCRTPYFHRSTASKWLLNRLLLLLFRRDVRLCQTFQPNHKYRSFLVHDKRDEFISREIITTGFFDFYNTLLLRDFIDYGNHVIDIGANIGWYSSLFCQWVGANGTVDAFEPDTANRSLLHFNTILLVSTSSVNIYPYVVSDRKGEVIFYKSITNMGDHRLFPDQQTPVSTKVTSTTLDEHYMSTDVRPNFVKCDTQGAEIKVLRGATELFNSGWRPLMLLEFWPYGLIHSGDNPMTMIDILDRYLYKSYFIDLHINCIELVSRRFFEEYVRAPKTHKIYGEHINILCIPESRHADLALIISKHLTNR